MDELLLKFPNYLAVKFRNLPDPEKNKVLEKANLLNIKEIEPDEETIEAFDEAIRYKEAKVSLVRLMLEGMIEDDINDRFEAKEIAGSLLNKYPLSEVLKKYEKNTVKRQIKLTLLMALTADGFTARNSHEYTNWTSKADKKLFFEITQRAKVIIMGKNTYKTLPSVLKDRLNIIMGKSDKENSEKNLRFFSGEPDELLNQLEKEGFKEAILCGGASTNSKFYEKGLIDEAIFTISPFLFGKGLSVFNKEVEICLELKNCEKIDKNTIMLNYLFK